MKSLKEKLGIRIQQIRKSKNITQERLVEAVGLDTPNLSNIERGKRFVTAETLEKIIQALEIEEKDLFDFGHIKSRVELINEIQNILNLTNDKELTYYYRLIKLNNELHNH